MPPHNLFDSDCEAVPSMGQLFNSLLSNSINTFTPMCNDSAGSPRVYSPTYPMNNPPPPSTSSSASSKTARRPNGLNGLSVSTSAAAGNNAPDPRRPPLNPINHHHHHKEYKKSTSFRERKKFGLSVDVPPHSSDPHLPRGVDNYNGNGNGDGNGGGHRSPISSPRNIELRRKSLSERHFFRPVSEDDESTIVGGKQ